MKTLSTKLFALQNELGAISKEEANPFFKSKYFDINGLIKHVKPLLATHGLILVQPLAVVDGKNVLTTILIHAESEERIESSILLPEEKDPQKLGSAITYYRRYAIQSLLLLEAEDDDGNKASQPTARAQNNNKPANAKILAKPDTFIFNGYEYATAISAKTDKPWYARQLVGTKEKEWLTAFDFDKAYSDYQASLKAVDMPYSELGQ